MSAPDSWLDALYARHTAALTTRELARALRALSIRYVEKRDVLPTRSPLDTAGKRAAFAVLYAPIHFLTTREIVRALGAAHQRLDVVVDLGCGTGVASAAWARELSVQPELRGIDQDAWAVREAGWTWRQLGLEGRARRADLVDAANRLSRLGDRTGIIAGWSVNELSPAARRTLLPVLLRIAARPTAVLVIEPLARGATPWWDEWASAFLSAGGRNDVWKFDVSLPARLAALDAAAGFRREHLGGRSLWLNLQ